MCSFRLMIVYYSFDNCQKKESKGCSVLKKVDTPPKVNLCQNRDM